MQVLALAAAGKPQKMGVGVPYGEEVGVMVPYRGEVVRVGLVQKRVAEAEVGVPQGEGVEVLQMEEVELL